MSLLIQLTTPIFESLCTLNMNLSLKKNIFRPIHKGMQHISVKIMNEITVARKQIFAMSESNSVIYLSLLANRVINPLAKHISAAIMIYAYPGIYQCLVLAIIFQQKYLNTLFR